MNELEIAKERLSFRLRKRVCQQRQARNRLPLEPGGARCSAGRCDAESSSRWGQLRIAVAFSGRRASLIRAAARKRL